jgi:hypothetical protein
MPSRKGSIPSSSLPEAPLGASGTLPTSGPSSSSGSGSQASRSKVCWHALPTRNAKEPETVG